MHLSILTDRQLELIPLLRRWKRSFYLVGGTAIALHLGHRRSIDFDLFTASPLAKARIRKALDASGFEWRMLHEDSDQLHVMCNHVKLTFFSYPYPIEHPVAVETWISLPDLLSLAAMKAFALGRRAKWKDYVDLYFMLRDHFSVEQVGSAAVGIFGDAFSERLFREQLAYHADIDYTEAVDYVTTPVADETIRAGLIDVATRIL